MKEIWCDMRLVRIRNKAAPLEISPEVFIQRLKLSIVTFMPSELNANLLFFLMTTICRSCYSFIPEAPRVRIPHPIDLFLANLEPCMARHFPNYVHVGGRMYVNEGRVQN